MRAASCRPSIKKDLTQHTQAAFTLEIIQSGLTQSQAEHVEEQCIQGAPKHPKLYNKIMQGRPTKARQMWKIKRCNDKKKGL